VSWVNSGNGRGVTDLLDQCSTPRDPAVRRNLQGIKRASVCPMCALRNRVPKASARNNLPAKRSPTTAANTQRWQRPILKWTNLHNYSITAKVEELNHPTSAATVYP
jgi:hypothetical protein